METQIIELEKKYWQGMENHDYETVKNLTYFPCIVAGKNGVHNVDETTFKKMFESGDGDKIKVLGFSDFNSQALTETTVVTAYIIELEDSKQKKIMKCACTSTWVKQNNEWVCALHTETELTEE
ncbi:DUF4440 domain-containing protein [Flavobacterium quisquiliarum]|uniref:DUF4440 domain-containing protein n=1 Tax=Flavobacterium quisquiliarum TaxID=1834436 RepID=A0ABV8VZC9_9FLAO|nr:DUF4440 domain-containing protein [Flavobacterium quisquiliarum]MBW1654594.1 DUF4440 domain-containing protein [Flavobacterium quisquiliarum]NWL01720.1 DUF4440 domain-containing protein [Flavobacterium collinsii]